ncbi:hypothetical protein ACFQX7_24940 [Luedemannella flava]
MRIVRLANFVTPTSGGLRTSLQHLGRVIRQRVTSPSWSSPACGPATR